ncbi:hypothetical protein CEXT_159341 [Caerostris extrusa]|uniref:Maturase K n=1 Tax=Caerostris extrusa TaxID=172846 RepID=A0AAV4V7J7_CAEEX|nr:hypothetical protein CEXT_159341 [Caerostris extrusa]
MFLYSRDYVLSSFAIEILDSRFNFVQGALCPHHERIANTLPSFVFVFLLSPSKVIYELYRALRRTFGSVFLFSSNFKPTKTESELSIMVLHGRKPNCKLQYIIPYSKKVTPLEQLSYSLISGRKQKSIENVMSHRIVV